MHICGQTPVRSAFVRPRRSDRSQLSLLLPLIVDHLANRLPTADYYLYDGELLCAAP
jgi:hypothetical protein